MSGTTRLESADENRQIHVNKFELFTDPYLLDSQGFNGQLVSQYPRTYNMAPTANLVPNAGAMTYHFFDFNLLTIYPASGKNTFNGVVGVTNPDGQIPTIVYTTEINRIAGNTDQLVFPKGGYWSFHAHAELNTALTTIDTAFVLRVELSVNSGGAWNVVAQNVATIGSAAAPNINGLSVNFQNYFSKPTATVPANTERMRISIASSQAMAGGVGLNLRLTRIR